MASPADPRNIVIIGGGIIGCSTAYFLTRHPCYDASKHKITILEASKIAGGASGKAGGLLALWAFPAAIVPLSFKLHDELAKEHGGDKRWGYRRLHVGSITAQGRAPAEPSNGQAVHQNEVDRVSLQKRSKEAMAGLRAAGVADELDWVAAECVRGYDEMGNPNNTAQVHPYQFTTSMADLACDAGAKVILGRAVEIKHDATGGVQGISYIDKAGGDPKQLPATDIVLTAGPWTPTIYPPAPIAALRAHSVTIRPKQPVSAYALFTEISIPASKKGGRAQHVAPEIYARPDGEVYACGEGDRLVPLPETTADVETDPQRCQAIVDQVASVSDELRDGEVTVRQACYLPNVIGAAQGPLVGKTGVRGLFLAAGHTCWGIQNAPGTGKIMSEFVFDGEAKSARVKSLDPQQVL